jgi:hypothetical protein
VPFTGENFVAVALRHLNESPPSLRERRPDVSPRLEAAVDRALAKDPERRFPSMAALAQELRACLAEADGAAPAAEDDAALTLVTPRAAVPAQAPPPGRVRPPRRASRSRRRPLAYVVLALVVAGAAFAAVLLLGGGSHHNGGSGGGGSSGSAVQLHGVGDYDPQGNGGEHSDTAPQATDGSASTSWTTESYGNQDFGGLKDGLGLVLDAGSPLKLTQLTVTTPTPGFTAEIQTGDSSTGGFTADSSPQPVSGTTKFTLDGKTAQYYVVWITQLPPGNRAEISEVKAAS